MSRVVPMQGGPYSLRCLDCGVWVPNTANAEMAKEGVIAYDHHCVASVLRHLNEGVDHIQRGAQTMLDRLADIKNAEEDA